MNKTPSRHSDANTETIVVSSLDDLPETDGAYIIVDPSKKKIPRKRIDPDMQIGEKADNCITTIEEITEYLGLCGEIPSSIIKTLTSLRIQKNVCNQKSLALYSKKGTKERYLSKLLLESGSGKAKTIRLSKSGKEILRWLDADLLEYYTGEYKHNFSGSSKTVERNHRQSETIIMCGLANFGIKPYNNPKLVMNCVSDTFAATTNSYYYRLKDIPLLTTGEVEEEKEQHTKLMFTRAVGMILGKDRSYLVYNTGKAVMKWNGNGEKKLKVVAERVMKMQSAGGMKNGISEAILFGYNYLTGISVLNKRNNQYVVETGPSKGSRDKTNFEDIFSDVYFLPISPEGVRMLRFMSVANWEELTTIAVFGTTNEKTYFYDKIINGVKYYSFLDGNIARLARVKEALLKEADGYNICCFDYQEEFIKAFFAGEIKTTVITQERFFDEVNKFIAKE